MAMDVKKASAIKGQVDFGIITIREDEFEAVLQRFPKRGVARGRRHYNLSEVETLMGDSYLTAVIRCIEPGNGEAMNAATDFIDELAPQWLLVVGIAGGMPANEFSLGDVVVSTHVHDFSVEAVTSDGSREYESRGWPIHPDVASIVANLPAMRDELGDWSSPASIGEPRPPVDLDASRFYGSDEWKARETLQRQFEGKRARPPLVTAGPIASSDRLIKDTEIATNWLRSARQVLAVEMESAGVYRAAFRRNVPVLAIRGISDVIGFKRDPGFTAYACHTAAAFARAFVRAQPIEPRAHAAAPAATTSAARSRSPTPALAHARTSAAEAGRPGGAAPRAAGRGRNKVFISFCPQDRAMLDALKEALSFAEKKKLITTWDTTQMLAGDTVPERIKAALDAAKIAVLLVSSHFLASDERESEVSVLLSAGVRLLCLYIDHSMVELASYAYTDPETGAKKKLKLVDLAPLNDRNRPLKGMSSSERSAALVRAVKMILETAATREGEDA